MRTRPIALLAAVRAEATGLLRLMRNKRSARKEVWTGTLSGLPVVLSLSGLGLANAARTATMLLELHNPMALINFGIAGAYVRKGGLALGDVAAASIETYADAGLVAQEGTLGFETLGFPLMKRGRKVLYNDFPLDKRLLKHAALACQGVKGRFLTVSAATGTLKHAEGLLARYPDAICENMEGAALAHVCAHYATPMAELRGISNYVEDRDRSRWDIGLAAGNSQEAVLRMLRGLRDKG